MIRKYLYIWFKTTALSLETILTTKAASLMYLGGKLLRFFIFFWLILRIGDQVEKVSGFTVDQLVVFFLIFNLFDSIGQLFFRGVYWFREDVVSGKLDLILLRPMSALFQIMTKRTDFLDVPVFLLVIIMLAKRSINFPFETWLVFGVMMTISIILITAIHIFVVAVGILTTEVDHLMLIYRDFSTMTRLPIDIYLRPIQILLTLVVPVGVIMTFPAKAFLGILSWPNILLGLVLGAVFLGAGLSLWRYSLSKYSSASS